MAVCLEAIAGRHMVGRMKADRFRADLRAAGLGSGCHGFELALPARTARGTLQVRRIADGAILGRPSPVALRV